MPPLKPQTTQWRFMDEASPPGRAEEFLPDFSRRKFLQALSLPALATLVGCDGPPPDAVPYIHQPESVIPGVPRFYASAVIFDGYAQPVIAETHEGRPTKLEGNPDHPCSRGATDAFAQAAVADLYNPERSAAPLFKGRPVSWADSEAFLLSLYEDLKASRGEGLRLLTGPITSPTLIRQINALLVRYPAARWHGLDSAGQGLRPAAIRSVFGDDYDVHLHPESADVIVAFDDDFLGPGPFQTVNAMRWADRRRRAAQDNALMLLHVVESTPSLAGAVATSRKALGPARITTLLNALAHELGVIQGVASASEGWEHDWIAARAKELRQAGNHALVIAGAYLPVEAQCTALAINLALKSAGTTIQFTKSVNAKGAGSLQELVKDMAAGAVKSLCVIDANPVFAAPGDIDFAAALRQVPKTLHLGLYDDETAAECQWHLPITHALESWSDARAVDGTVTVLQPLVRSFLDVRSVHDILHRLATGEGGDARALVQETWAERLGSSGVEWPHILDRGYVEETTSAPVLPELRFQPVSLSPASEGAFEIVIRPDPNIWDGSLAPNLWLQELPKPLTKVTWENVILIAPSDAIALKVANGDMVEIAAAHGGKVSGPAWIQPGQAGKTITAFLGYGRRRAGRHASAIGYDAAPLRTAGALWQTAGTPRRVEGRREIATTQAHSDMGDFDFVKIVARGESVPTVDDTVPSLYPPRERGPVAWGMVVDLDLCIGCNACVVACQAENNIPVVGQDQVRRGREMQWLRIDRYFQGTADEPAVHFQPVPCMHCEQAPCEMGCPVHATTHSSEGLNQMVYNRCIGTRTCSSYCPYKVRRFNWYDYTSNASPGEQAQHNPNVTVRGRGVMEKCTYCVQRINAAEIKAQKEDRGIRDGEVRTACQAACPTQAIVFGNISESGSGVSRQRQNPRNYSLLAELGTHPRTTYLAKISDAKPNKESAS